MREYEGCNDEALRIISKVKVNIKIQKGVPEGTPLVFLRLLSYFFVSSKLKSTSHLSLSSSVFSSISTEIQWFLFM